MTAWFVLVIISAVMSFVLPVVGVMNRGCTWNRRVTLVVLGLVFCTITLIFVFAEILGYVSANDIAALLDTIGTWMLLSMVFSVVSLVVSMLCFFSVVRRQQ